MGVGDVLGIQDKKKSVFRDNFVFFSFIMRKKEIRKKTSSVIQSIIRFIWMC